MFLIGIYAFIASLLCALTQADGTESPGSACGSNIVLFLPLDERFTTRDAFINLAKVTPFCILTPDPSLLPSLKVPAKLPELHKWVDDNIQKADVAIISSEMYIYGGLINSRVSNDTTSTLYERLDRLSQYAYKYDVKFYISNVVMRIPGYNGDFEEPWFWENYGYDLFEYSYNQDEFEQLGDIAALRSAEQYKALVPSNATSEFLWRRARNHNVTLRMFELMQTSKDDPPFEKLYVTLDDNAKFGFNIREAAQLESQVNKMPLNVQDRIAIYPGADEVQLAMLSMCAIRVRDKGAVRLGVVYRDPKSSENVPNYEGQPMSTTLLQQVEAAGGVITNLQENMHAEVDAILFVNNFSSQSQLEASAQPSDDERDIVFKNFHASLIENLNKRPLGFCDNRYSNGADKHLVSYIARWANSSRLETITYAGWNTDGNTIGTVVSNTILLSLHWNRKISRYENAAFNSLRLIEDYAYQAVVRNDLVAYLSTISPSLFPNQNSISLGTDLPFYTAYSYKQLASMYQRSVQEVYNLPGDWLLSSIYYPWNRTFEAGFLLSARRTLNIF